MQLSIKSAPLASLGATSPTSRRTTRALRMSNSSCRSSFTSSSSSNDAFKRNLSDYSPASEALSLTDETDFDDEECKDETPEDLDEEWDFEPKAGDAVWVKSKDTERETWYHGLVQKSTRTGTVRGGKQGTFYSVRYHRNLRRYFAPLLGEIKPDTPRVRRLLAEAGCDMEA